MAKSQRREIRDLNELLPYCRQANYYVPLSEHNLQALADDIRRNGLHHPIEVLPGNKSGLSPNTILKGHERTRALLLVGETETEVVVRYDLADATAEEIERVVLDDNQHRKHLDKLSQARVALRLYEIEQAGPRGRRSPKEEPEARDRVGKTIGMTGRNLSRYLRILKTPIEVQRAFTDQKLTLVTASNIAGLPQATRAKIAARIRAGEKPVEVAAKYLARKQSPSRLPVEPVAFFTDTVTRAVAQLHARSDAVDNENIAAHERELKRCRVAIKRLLDRITE